MPQELTPEIIMQKVSSGKQFTLLHLITAKPLPDDLILVNQLQMQHLTHLFQLEQAGHTSVFGPVLADARLRGIIIFNTTDKSKIKSLMSTDPYIKAGYLTYELFEFFTIPGQKIAGNVK
jgi:uncharacterized protein YciI